MPCGPEVGRDWVCGAEGGRDAAVQAGGWASGGLLPRGCAPVPGVSGVSAGAAGPVLSLD